MNYEDYLQGTMDMLKERLIIRFPKVELQTQSIAKNNSIQVAIVIDLKIPLPEENMKTFSLVIYPMNKVEYTAIKNKEHWEAHVNSLYETLISGLQKDNLPNMSLNEFINPENLRISLVGKNELNDEMLQDIVRKDYLDMIVFCKFCRIDEEERTMSLKVNMHMLELLGMSEEEVFERAMRNTFKEDFTIRPMIDILKELSECIEQGSSESFLEDLEIMRNSVGMYVVSNTRGLEGAIAMFFPEVFKSLSAQLDGNLYILPSSIHECIVIGVKDVNDAFGFTAIDELKEMVVEINQTQIQPEEKLTDSVYEYLTATNCIVKVK